MRLRIARSMVVLLPVVLLVPDGRLVSNAESPQPIGAATKEVWPGEQWRSLASPEQAGWSVESLRAAKKVFDEIGSTAVVIVQNGVVVQQWGETAKPYPVYSVRKSLFNSILGIAIGDGELKLDQTLKSLGIDDTNFALNETEKSATIKSLLTSRSGVYHRAAYEAKANASRRPERGSHRPDEFFYYNNWDFNALGTIYNQTTGRDLFQDFDERISTPIKMQDFSVHDTQYRLERASVHPAYLFKMSARDLARFGLLYLRQGRWHDRQIVPADWVHESTRTQVPDAMEHGSYGYLWWTYPKYGDHYAASGNGGQMLVVVPKSNLVIAHLAQKDAFGRGGVKTGDFWRLFQMIVKAVPNQ